MIILSVSRVCEIWTSLFPMSDRIGNDQSFIDGIYDIDKLRHVDGFLRRSLQKKLKKLDQPEE